MGNEQNKDPEEISKYIEELKYTYQRMIANCNRIKSKSGTFALLEKTLKETREELAIMSEGRKVPHGLISRRERRRRYIRMRADYQNLVRRLETESRLYHRKREDARNLWKRIGMLDKLRMSMVSGKE